MRLATYLPPYKWYIALALFFMVAAGAASSLIATLLGKLTDIGFYNQEPWIVIAAPVALIFISVLHGGSMFMSNYLLGKVSQSVLVKLRGQMFHQVLHWPAETIQKNSTGNTTSKFIFEGNVALSSATKSCIILVRDSCQVAALCCVLFWHNWMLALVSLVIGPLVAKLLRYISDNMKKVMATCQASFGSLLSSVKNACDAQRVIKLAGSYDYEKKQFSELNEGLRKMMVNMTKIMCMGTPVTQFICMSGVAVVLAFAMYQTHLGLLTLGDFVTFLAALLLLIPPLKNLAGINAGFVMMNMAAQSLFAAIDEPAEADNGKVIVERVVGNVTFEHVALRYPGSQKDAVHDFNLEVKAGDVIALVGLSGSGKSTLVNMIPRFRNPTSGRILIDGIDTQDMTLASLRRQIAVVDQDVTLFDDTIRANIAYGKPEATDAEIMEAVEAAALTDFIASLPEGLDTQVGESGGRLSGGQKQRISIARALLKNAPILILDEATSALDSESEAHIKEALARLMKGRTVFIVAHRLSTVENAAKIIGMSDGIVREAGTRAELLERNGLYAELCRLQAVKTSEAR